jgi:hypothetical protein
MNMQDIENKVSELIKNLNEDTFVYDLLLAYNLPKSTITRLEKGTANLSKIDGEVNLKKKLFFKKVEDDDLHLTLSKITEDLKHENRFVIVTDFRTLIAKDTKINTTLDIQIKDLPKNFDFFLPWAGLEKSQYQNENPADNKAAMKMGKLFDQIKSDNNDESEEFLRRLNVFLSRLLFCFFAEDSDIFEENMFSNRVGSLTSEDGSDLKEFFEKLFNVLNTKEEERSNIPNYLNSFPYVNGGLFKEKVESPRFSKKSRSIIIESGTLSWKDINPDIFGSMFQAVNYANERGALGQHFTSVVNILKVINPLFMDDLRAEFEEARGNNKKLKQLLFRLKNIKVFDPACGSGNFLIIAYKELRRMEMEIFKEMGSLALSEISLSQFYGIEIDEFAKEIAILALWLSKHQMNKEFFKEFGRTSPTLPLTDAGNIVQDNACRVDWEKVCPKNEDDEIYILGNPPYKGSKKQNKEQKEDLKIVFNNDYKSLDYISAWFYKGSKFIKGYNSSLAFVSTNSICQGDLVAKTWPRIINKFIEIGFAHKSFKWSNSAKGNAGVSVVIVGLSNSSKKNKFIYSGNLKKKANNINAYLIDYRNIIIKGLSKPISMLPIMVYGSQPNDNGNLILSREERNYLIETCPESLKYIKELVGTEEFLNDSKRWCLIVEDEDLEHVKSIPPIKERLDKTKAVREKSNRKETKELAKTPHRFGFFSHQNTDSILVPRHSSERREYIPFGLYNQKKVIADSALAIYDSDPWLFSVISSKIHMVWVRAIGGKLETRLRYSSKLCYNTFPIPSISNQRKEELTQCTLKIIDERLKHSEKTIAQLYDPDKMPEGLKEVHHQNDLAVERCYRSNPFNSDEERLEHLFKLYEKMIEEEKFQNTLFAKEKKTRKRKTT